MCEFIPTLSKLIERERERDQQKVCLALLLTELLQENGV